MTEPELVSPAGRARAARRLHGALGATVAPPDRPFDPATLPSAGRSVRLPPPEPLPPIPFGEVLAARRSRYRAAPRPPTGAALATVMHHATATVPRAGGLPSIEAYVVVLCDTPDRIPAGVYRYGGDRLDAVRAGPVAGHVAATFLQPEFADRFPVVIVLTARTDVAFGRYALRHYRTVHVEAGAVLQNLYLTAEATGLAGCAVSGFDDERLARVLALDDTGIALVAFVLGVRTGP